ncbi:MULTISPECIES: CAP domain-containing protein [Streptomyces]|uniref:CAP domain-containing protein n=1 Tax=Streptomyces eurythermus TaxID=42237 RepID=A0ABW6Z0F3_9ACTN|nr:MULTISPECIES: CAP domain-containing protein [Streptomyces]QIS73397.1 CAP domain-containing protein [Streptomyces sp. DSM 40868]
MGRHRRSAAGSDDPRHAHDPRHSPAHPSSGDRPVPADIGPYPAPEAYAEATAKAQAYLFATDDEPTPAAPESGSAPDSGTDSGSGDGGRGGDAGGEARGGDRPWSKAVRPVRAALLGVAVAVVLGTAAVGSGAVPGLEHYRLGGGTDTTGGERTGAVASPGNTASEQGGTSGSVGTGATAGSGDGSATAGSGDGGGRPTGSSDASPSGAASASKPAPAGSAPARTATGKPSPATGKPSSKAGPRKTPGTGRTEPAEPAPAEPSGPAKPSASGTPAKPAPQPKPKPSKPKATPSRTATPTAAPSRTPEPPAPAPSSPTDTVAREAAVEAEVLKLVNDERAKAGLGALAANSALTGLAEAFSDDMAARGFFSHTDPDGRSPWDRAARAGVTSLGAENIGRGQADAAAVLAAWMDSPENRANILNPGFTTFGAGVHLGPGGPWWTLEFGS